MSGSVTISSNSPTTFGYTGAAITCIVPHTGLYDIAAFGAQGGSGETAFDTVYQISSSGQVVYGTQGGLGAEVGGDIELTAGEVLTIVVGGQGASGAVGGGGGGGGSFVLGPNNTPLVIGGGGGGGGGTLSENIDGTAGGAGNAGSSGGNGSLPVQDAYGDYAGLGGTGGSGGGGSNGDGAGGGGGLNSAGGSGLAVNGTPEGNGGGARGGAGGVTSGNSAGGFGGGGGADIPGGGGGGYSGGGGGADVIVNEQIYGGGGGGGGSFDAGTLNNADLVQRSGVQSGNGTVTITPLVPIVVPESFSANYGTVLTLKAAQLLAGDTDRQGGALTVTAVNGNGAVLNPNGTITYSSPSTPVAGNTASFTYTVTDTAGFAATATATITLTTPLVASTINGAVANQPTTDETTISPFAGVTITDLNSGSPTDAITITLTGSGGTATDANGTLEGTGLTETSVGSGVYTLAATDPTTLTGELHNLIFTPAPHQVAPGGTVATTFTLSDQNSAGQTTINRTTSVVATAVNDPATISGPAAGSVTEDGTATAGGMLTVSDPDVGQARFQAPPSASLTGTYGAFTFDPTTGKWGYTLSNSSQIVQALGAGQHVTDTLNVTSLDGTATQPITVTINGTDDAPTLKSQTLPVGSVAGGQTSSNLYSQVLANVQDVDTIDQGKLTITSVALATGTTGAVFLDPTSKVLIFTADAYNAKQSTDSFTYTAADPEGTTVSGTVTVPITPGTLQPTVLGTPGNDTLTANGAGAVVFAGRGNDTVTVNGAKGTVYGGLGTNTITLNGAQQTVVLEQGGTDNISGFNLKNDVLDLRQVLAEAQRSFNPADFQLTSSGSNATLSYIGTPSFTGGSALATLVGVGPGLTLQALISDGALKTA